MRSLVLVDIDGVVNSFPSTPNDRVHWPEDSWRTDHVYDPDVGYAFALNWSTAAVDRLRSIEAMPTVDMRWCTTWQHKASSKFAPIVGVGAGWDYERDAGRERRGPPMLSWWKADAAKAALSQFDRVAWVDDDIDAWTSVCRMSGKADTIAWMADPRLLAICPKTTRGFELKHFESIEGHVR